MDEIPQSGTEADMRRRTEKERVDTPELRNTIHQARRQLFKGFSLAGDKVQKDLKGRSLNPIQVRLCSLSRGPLILIYICLH